METQEVVNRLDGVSRQRRWQLKQRSKNRCIICGGRLSKRSVTLCYTHRMLGSLRVRENSWYAKNIRRRRYLSCKSYRYAKSKAYIKKYAKIHAQEEEAKYEEDVKYGM